MNEHVQALEALTLSVDQWDAILVYWLLAKLDAESSKQFDLAYPSRYVLTFTSWLSWIDEAAQCNLVVTSLKLPFPRRFLGGCLKKTTVQLLSTRNLSDERMQWTPFNLSVWSLQAVGHTWENDSDEKAQTVHELSGAAFRGWGPVEVKLQHWGIIHPYTLIIRWSSKVVWRAVQHSVLLSTAMVGIYNTTGKTLMFRGLPGTGSQTSLITADAASKLNYGRSTVDVKNSGIGGTDF